MAKQMIEIEVDVPDGYEVTGEYRLPKKGEHYLSADIYPAAHVAHSDFTNCIVTIIRRKYVPPSWLKPGTWLHLNIYGQWEATDLKPIPHSNAHTYQGRSHHSVVSSSMFPGFVPPPTSPYQIPEAK